MARNMAFERQASYRAVILRLYSASHGSPLAATEPLEYHLPDGTVHLYHSADAYGPYAKRGQAKSILGREMQYMLSPWNVKGLANIVAFTETTTIDWDGFEEYPVDLT